MNKPLDRDIGASQALTEDRGASQTLPTTILYDGFLSYRHDDRQLAIVRAMQRALHGFAKPWFRLRAMRLYRDETDLAIRPDAWNTIQQALDASRYLVLIASPAAAKTPFGKSWCG